jgi:hypothetical protein
MKKACKECPFLKKSAPGWLGSDTTPMEFRTEALSESGYSCHMTLNKPKETQCIGALAHAKISCKRFSNKELQDAMKDVDTENIMTVPEFVKHHTR